MRFRLLALDIDGSLVDPAGALRPRVRDAVRRAAERGLQVVLCTGRRFRTTQWIVEEIGLEGPVVCQNGGVTVDAASGATLAERLLQLDVYPEALSLLRRVASPLVYVNHAFEEIDIISEAPESAHPFQQRYLADYAQVARVVDSLDEPPSKSIVMLSCMAASEPLAALQPAVDEALGGRVRTNYILNKNYEGHILEIVGGESGKWPALHQVAQQAGVAPEEILAIGDDRNDAEMLREAGLGVAMANAAPDVREAADEITPSNEEDGVALAIERFALA